MTSPTYRASTAADVVECLPSAFGFMPQESLVAIALQGPNRRMGFRMRLDLPPEDELVAAGQMVGHHLDRQHADSVILIGLSENLEHAHQAVGMTAREISQPIVVAGVAHRGQFFHQEPWDYGEGSIAGEPYNDPMTSNPTCMAVAEGQSVHRSREDYAAQFAPTPTQPYVAPQRERLTPGDLRNAAPQRVAAALQTGVGRDSMIEGLTLDNSRRTAERLLAVAKAAHKDNANNVYAVTAMAYYISGDGPAAVCALEHAGDSVLASVLTSAAQAGIPPAELLRTAQVAYSMQRGALADPAAVARGAARATSGPDIAPGRSAPSR